MPSGNNTFKSVTVSNRDGIDLLFCLENRFNSEFLLEEGISEIDLLGSITTIDLDFYDVSLLVLHWELFWLGVSDDSDLLAVLFDEFNLLLHFLWILLSLGFVLGELVGWGESGLSHSSLDGFSDVGSPDGVSWSEASWGKDVTDHTAANHSWSIENGELSNDLLLDLLTSRTFFNETESVGGTSLEGNESGEVWLLGLIVSWEALDLWS